MEIYTLNSSFQRVDVVDEYESLIWTERFQEIGEFNLDVILDDRNYAIFTEGTFLNIDPSKRIMQVETVEEATSHEGKKLLKVSGRSIESILMYRVAKQHLVANDPDPDTQYWVLNGNFKNIIQDLFAHICRPPAALHNNDLIPLITAGSIFPADTMTYTHFSNSYIVEPQSLYSAIKKIADDWALGFRLVCDVAQQKLYFDAYRGVDRRLSQSAHPPVVFDPDLDDFFIQSSLRSIQNYVNTVYTLVKPGDFFMSDSFQYRDSSDQSATGFDRRVAYAQVARKPGHVYIGTPHSNTAWEKVFLHRRRVNLHDGEISPMSRYRYGVDYNVGDVVILKDRLGESFDKRVTEFIFTADNNGVKAYPTLAELELPN